MQDVKNENNSARLEKNLNEKEIFEWAMKKVNNNVSSAAEILGLPRSTL